VATEPVVQEAEDVVPETVEIPERPHGARRVWSWLWPKLAALALFVAAWQLVVWSGWRPDYVLPGPLPVFQRLFEDLSQPDFYLGVGVTLRRALAGVDQVQPLLVRVGRVIGARGLQLYRYVILPAALPGYVGGLKQGWAFAWRSLMAGEIINIVSHQPSLGQQLQFARDFADAQQLLALMIVIFFIGVVVDLGFGFADRAIRRRRGLA